MPLSKQRVRFAVVVAVAAPVVMWAAVALQDREATLARVVREVDAQSIALAEQTARILDAQALAADFIDQAAREDDCAALRRRADLAAAMRVLIERNRMAVAAWIIDASGAVCTASDPVRMSSGSRAFRDYYAGARAAGPGGYYVDRAIVDLGDGAPVFAVAKYRGHGAFRGAVVTAVRLTALRKVWEDILRPGQSRRLAVHRADGAVVAQSWGPLVPPTDPDAEHERAVFLAGDSPGTWSGTALHEWNAIGAWQQVPGWNVLASVSADHWEALAPWRERMIASGFIAALSTGLLVMLATLWYRSQARLRAVNEHLREEVSRQTRRLVEADRAKDEFMAVLAHELRGPLHVLAACVQLLVRSRETAEPSPDLADKAGRQIARIERLVADLNEVARITSGNFILRKEQVDVVDLVDEAVEIAEEPIRQAGHRLKTFAPPRGTVMLRVDRVRVVQTLVNLLTNAARYTPAGGRISVVATVLDGEARITVADSGIGLDAESSQRLFALFQRGERAKQMAGGLGVGLALSRHIARLHGGDLTVESDGPGTGSRFTVALPIEDGRKSDASDRRPSAEPPKASMANPGA